MLQLPPAVSDTLRSQYGTISLAQARDLGLADGQRRHLLESGRWDRLAPSVYGAADHRTTWIRSLWIAHLHCGPDSVIAFESAGRLRSFSQVPARRVVLIVSRVRRNPPAGVVQHRLDDLEPQHVSHMSGLPVTTAMRTTVDLAATMHIASFRLLVEAAVVEHRFTVAQLGAFVDGIRRRGKPGMALLTSVLDDLGPGDSIPHSELERLLDEVIRLSGLPAPSHEYPLPGRGASTGFVDRCWPEAKLIVEGDGRKWHTRRQQVLKDATRRLEAQAVGYETSPLLWEHLTHDPPGTADLLRSVYQGRLELVSLSTK